MNQAREIALSFETIVDMVRDRGLYVNGETQEMVDFRDKEMEAMATNARPVFSIDFPACAIRIVYDMHQKFKVNDVKKLLDYAGVVMLVSREKPGTLALKGLEEASNNIQVTRAEFIDGQPLKRAIYCGTSSVAMVRCST